MIAIPGAINQGISRCISLVLAGLFLNAGLPLSAHADPAVVADLRADKVSLFDIGLLQLKSDLQIYAIQSQLPNPNAPGSPVEPVFATAQYKSKTETIELTIMRLNGAIKPTLKEDCADLINRMREWLLIKPDGTSMLPDGASAVGSNFYPLGTGYSKTTIRDGFGQEIDEITSITATTNERGGGKVLACSAPLVGGDIIYR